jgi:voltage-gated potassium channel Kch
MISQQRSPRLSDRRPRRAGVDRNVGYAPWAVQTITAFHLIIAGGAFLLGVAALIAASTAIGAVSIAVTNLYVLSMLRCCAIASTPNLSRRPYGRGVKSSSNERWEVIPYLPTRMTALVLMPILLAALIAAFAGFYLATNGGVVDSQTPARPLVSRLDALYFSFVTITTLGYGDFHPVSALAKCCVMCEVASGLIMLVGALPLLIGRLTMWKD